MIYMPCLKHRSQNTHVLSQIGERLLYAYTIHTHEDLITGPDAKTKPSGRDLVEGEYLLGQNQWMTSIYWHNAKIKADMLRLKRGSSKDGHCINRTNLRYPNIVDASLLCLFDFVNDFFDRVSRYEAFFFD